MNIQFARGEQAHRWQLRYSMVLPSIDHVFSVTRFLLYEVPNDNISTSLPDT